MTPETERLYIERDKAYKDLIRLYEDKASILDHPSITTYSIPMKERIASLTAQIEKATSEKEKTITALENGLYATNKFTTDECTEIAEGLWVYINESLPVFREWKESPSDQPSVTDEQIDLFARAYGDIIEGNKNGEITFAYREGAQAMRDGKIPSK